MGYTPRGIASIDESGEHMCSAVTCKTCGKTTWAGCGQHVDSVKAGVPRAQWCSGHTAAETQAAKIAAAQSKTGFFSRMFAGR